MIKTIFFSLLLLALSQSIFAAEKASTVLTRYNFLVTELNDIFTKYPELANLVIASDTQAFLGEEYNPTHFSLKLYSENSDDVYILEKNDSHFDIVKTYVPFDIEVKTIEGEIHNTLYETLKKETDSEKIAQQMAKAFSEDFTTTKGLRVGASYSFDVIEYFDTGFVVGKKGDLKFSEFLSKALGYFLGKGWMGRSG